jgi:formate C-acetyltransferase
MSLKAKNSEPFHDSWMAHAGEPHLIRLAHAIVAQWLGSQMIVEPEEPFTSFEGKPIVGRLELSSIVNWSFPRGVSFSNDLWNARYEQADKEEQEYLEEMKKTWHGKTSGELVWSIVMPTERAVCSAQGCVGPGCHASPFHYRLASEGTEGLRRRILNSRNENLSKPGTEPAEWYDALLIILDGIDRFGDIYADVVRKEAEQEEDTRQQQRLLDISERCARVLKRPAQNFHDALQAYWFSFVLHGVDSPGRFDQDMGAWLEDDLKKGTLTREEAQKLVDCIWMKFGKHRAWSLTLSGQKSEGGDATNELTYMALESMRRLRIEAPNVSLRVHKDTPQKLFENCCELLASGYSMPAMVNDEPVIASMMERGVKKEDALDYTLVGCTQVVPRGRCCGSYEDLVINSLKCLELALHNGIDPITGIQMGPKTGEPEDFIVYEDFENACFEQLDYVIHTTTEVTNRQLALIAQHYPDFYKSLLIEGCLEKGKDYRRGGALYTEGLADVLGITNFGDSLLVIKKLVYGERHLRLREFVEILDKDWDGEESLRQECLNRIPKFGNNNEEADEMTVRVFNFINEGYKQREKVYGNHFGIDVVGWTGAVAYGKKTGATPDGRRRGTPLCDSIGPSQGRDKNSVTAVLQSVSKIPHDRAHGVLALNLKFSGNTFSDGDGVKKMMSLVNTAFDQGLQQLQINVVDAKTLRDAQANPDAYQSLIVRIGGFSTYFNWLSKEHQDDIIARTEHNY